MSRRFAHLPQVVEFWQGMIKDEASHVVSLRQIQTDLTAEQLQAEVDPNILWKAREISGFSVEGHLAQVNTLEDAYQLAHELEHSEVNTVFEFIMTGYVSDADRRAFALTQLREHMARLERFSSTSGGSGWRQTVVAGK